MRANKTSDTRLVTAAQAGDRQALDNLIEAHLPFVYTIVRRALSGDHDVDDIVQETMVRALRELHELRVPDSFRAWLAAIAVRQISTQLHRRHTAALRSVPLDDLTGTPDVQAPFEELTMLQLGLSQQRRNVAQAAGWLHGDDRLLLSLWWLEVAGHLTRSELATAVGVSVAHAGVRVQRMRQQLDQCRALVAALEIRPRCSRLEMVTDGWNGAPSPQWRRRILRHVDTCATCGRATRELVAADRLLVGLGLLPVPFTVAGALIGKSALIGSASPAAFAGAAQGGLFAQLTHAVATYRLASALVAAVLVTGTAAVVVNWPAAGPAPALAVPASSTPRPTASAALPGPSPLPSSPTPQTRPSSATPGPTPSPAQLLNIGPVSLAAASGVGLFATTADSLGVLAPLSPSSPLAARQPATFEVVAGINDPKCFSFLADDGRYLRHKYWRLQLDPNEDTALFRGDATFCVRAGSTPESVGLESSNYPGWFVHRRGDDLWVDWSDGSDAFLVASSFQIRPPLAG